MSFKAPPDFDPVSLEDTDLGDPNDCEFFLIRAPKGADIKKLNGMKFSQSRVKKLEVEEGEGDLTTVYELTPFQGQPLEEQPLVATNGKLRLGPPLSGLLSVTKSYKAKDNAVSEASSFMQSNGPVPMPEGLKVRFTPFGAGQPKRSRSKRKDGKKRKKQRVK